jgi:hypothetical protein
MRPLWTVHLLAPQAAWRRSPSVDKYPSLMMTYAAVPVMHRTKRQAAALVPVVMAGRRLVMASPGRRPTNPGGRGRLQNKCEMKSIL